MLFHLNTSDDRPIYSQIGDQVKFAVAAGLLAAGGAGALRSGSCRSSWW